MTRSPFAAVTRVEGIRAGALALALLMAGCATTPRPARSQEYLYVASQEDVTVSVIDMDARALVATVDLKELGYSPTAKAHHVAVEPDGSFWYVSLIADGKVLKFDRSNRLVGQVDFETPGMLALDPGSDLLYVGRSMAAVNPPRRVGIVRRSTMEMEEIDVFFPRPHALAVDPVRGRFYTASLGENSVAYAPLGEEEVDLLRVEAHHHHMFVQFAVSPDGRWMVTGGEMSGDLVVFDVSGDAPVAARTLHLGDKPWHPVFSPDGKELYVPRQTANAVDVLDTEEWSVKATITHPALSEPHGSAVSADGRTLFVSGRNLGGSYTPADGSEGRPGTVVAIDTGTREVVAVMEVGRYAAGMGAPTRVPPR